MILCNLIGPEKETIWTILRQKWEDRKRRIALRNGTIRVE